MGRLLAVVGCLVVLLGSCGGLNSDSGGVACDPPPRIYSSPPTEATVGQPYVYYVEAAFLCGMWNICNGFVAVQLPTGATIDPVHDSISWVPAANYANKDVKFAIATETDDCGDVARQSWTVHVHPAPPAP